MATAEAAVEKVKSVKYKSVIDELKASTQARCPYIWTITHEEHRFITDFVKSIAEKLNIEVFIWSSWQGVIKYSEFEKNSILKSTGDFAETQMPNKALDAIGKHVNSKDSSGSVFIMRDLHGVLTEPIVRQMRDMYNHMYTQNKIVLVVSPMMSHGPGGQNAGLPPALEKQMVVINYDLPTPDLIKTRLVGVINNLKQQGKGKLRLEYSEADIVEMVRALQGLTMVEIDTAISTSLVYLKELNPAKFVSEKRQLIRRSEILEFIDSGVNASDVGGLDNAKTYFEQYKLAFTDEAKAFGVEPLRGVLLTGVPGTGKSLLSKAIGNLWKVPLLRLDVGKVMTGLVGGSEGKMRQVIQQAESMAPCVLWIDEVEKSLSGTKSSNFSDSGTLSRVFGTLLTAMQDGLKDVTIIATANDISMLPPEFIRRFNEVFFVDLPGPEERWEILGIHLAVRNRNVKDLEKAKKEILAASENYTGAEIEKAVKDAVTYSFYHGKADLTGEHIVRALADTKPIYQVMGEKIKKLRDWARNRARYASSWAQTNAGELQQQAAKHTIDLSNDLDNLSEVKTSAEKRDDKLKKVKAKDRMASIMTEEPETTDEEDSLS